MRGAVTNSSRSYASLTRRSSPARFCISGCPDHISVDLLRTCVDGQRLPSSDRSLLGTVLLVGRETHTCSESQISRAHASERRVKVSSPQPAIPVQKMSTLTLLRLPTTWG